MGQFGFFDMVDRYAGLDAKNDRLLQVDKVIPCNGLSLTPFPLWAVRSELFYFNGLRGQ